MEGRGFLQLFQAVHQNFKNGLGKQKQTRYTSATLNKVLPVPR